MISIQNVSKQFGNMYALRHVDLEIETGKRPLSSALPGRARAR